MKLLYVSIALLLLASCGATEEDYENLASDMCGCMELGIMNPKTQKCMEDLEKKYDNVYTTDDDATVEKKLLEKMREVDGCENSADLLEMGFKMSNVEN